MPDAVSQCFREEFDRFHTLLEKQIGLFPDDLWYRKAGGYPVWQQVLHTLLFTLMNVGADDEAAALGYAPEVFMLSVEPERSMSREQMLVLAETAKIKAWAFIDAQSTETLTGRHEGMSARFGKTMTNQNVLIGLIRHTCYHLGCCDAVLRDNGLKGVY